MNLNKAIELDIKNSPFNKMSLSNHLYGNDNTLRHKIDGYKGSVLGIEDVMRIMESTGGRNAIASIAQSLGGLYVLLPEQPEILENQDLMTESQQVNVKLGEFFTEFQQISQDGEITPAEKQRMVNKGFDVCSQLMAFCKAAEFLYCQKEKLEATENGF